MNNRPSITSGLVATLLLHGGLIALLAFRADGCDDEAQADSAFAQSPVIEASLAFKEVKPKTKQPQKTKKKKFKPNEDAAASKADKAKPKEPKEKKPPVPEPEVDINSILNKNRNQDEDLSDTGAEETPVAGAADGSEWGSEKDAVNDPYVGELKGRITAEWKVPALETGTGKTVGCVRLNEDGAIVDRELKKRSSNSNLNRSVQLALKDASDMDKAVPGKLIQLLTVQGICFNFSLD